MMAGIASAPNGARPVAANTIVDAQANTSRAKPSSPAANCSVLAHDVRPAAVHAGLQHLGRAEPGDPAGELRLADEGVAGRGVPTEPRVEELDRDEVAGLALAEIDDALPSLADPAGDAVGAQATGVAGLQRLRHDSPVGRGHVRRSHYPAEDRRQGRVRRTAAAPMP
ncbi:hypothetical protein [Microbispora sp. NBC_01389]|uniref:hypothetical protein n=1 Tax=Microbispora sp. NBC_01389 TaxID=2903584 RepID=UPI00324C3637